MTPSIELQFNHYYTQHCKHLKLQGLQPKTIDAYSRAIRRIGEHFQGHLDNLSQRGVAIFAKACFGHPSPSKQQKLNATTYASGGPDSSSSPRPDPTRGRNIGSK